MRKRTAHAPAAFYKYLLRVLRNVEAKPVLG